MASANRPYTGSLLGGQFGTALRHVACMTHQPGCPLRATCPYTRVFDAPHPPTHSLQKFSAIPNAYVNKSSTRHALAYSAMAW